MKFRINVRAIIPHNGKILLSKNKNLPGFWCLPGGGLEQGEELREGLRREIIEETGVEPIVGKLLFIQQIGDGTQYNYPEFFFLVENGKDFENLDLSKASHSAGELDAMEFIDVTREPVLPEFLKEKIPLLISSAFNCSTELISTL